MCVALSNAECAGAVVCKRRGKCTAKDGECIAASDADCEKSTRCTVVGQCTAKDGVCVK